MKISKNQKDNWMLGIMIFFLLLGFLCIIVGKYLLMFLPFAIFFALIFFENWLDDKFLEAGVIFDDKKSCSEEIIIFK